MNGSKLPMIIVVAVLVFVAGFVLYKSGKPADQVIAPQQEYSAQYYRDLVLKDSPTKDVHATSIKNILPSKLPPEL